MALVKKIAGLAVGVSAVAAIGVAVAQGVPPNPFVANHALGAGQQSSHLTSMGETGVPGFVDQVQTAEVITVQVMGHSDLEPGQEVQVGLRSDQVHVFDAAGAVMASAVGR